MIVVYNCGQKNRLGTQIHRSTHSFVLRPCFVENSGWQV